MKKILLLLLLLFAVACGGPEAPVTNTVDSDESEASVSAVANDNAAVANDNAAEATAEVVTEDTAAEEQSAVLPSASIPDDFVPANTPAEAGEVRAFDHIKGAANPTVTIIEYGDYQ